MKYLAPAVTAVLFCGALRADAAPPKPKVKTVKPRITVDPQVKVELARVVKAYVALGDFSLSSSEVENVGSQITRRQFVGRFAVDGRRAMKKVDKGAPLVRLFDGQQLIGLEGSRPITRRAATKLPGGPEASRLFFEPSTGLVIIARMLEKKTASFGDADDITSSYMLRKLAGGKTQVENRAKKRSGSDVIDVVVRMNIGAPGYIEGITIAANIKGKPLLYMSTTFTRPTKLTGKDDFTWESFGPPAVTTPPTVTTSPANQPTAEGELNLSAR